MVTSSTSPPAKRAEYAALAAVNSSAVVGQTVVVIPFNQFNSPEIPYKKI